MNFIKGVINAIADPRLFFLLAVAGLGVIVWKREFVASKEFGYGMLGVLTVFFIFGTFDFNFRQIVTKPDNVPIVGLIFLLVFFVWYSIREAVLNDRRIAAGQAPPDGNVSAGRICGMISSILLILAGGFIVLALMAGAASH